MSRPQHPGGDLGEAVDRLNARKAAAGMVPIAEGGLEQAAAFRGDEPIRRGVFAGLDFDLDTLHGLAARVGVQTVPLAAMVGPAGALAGVWIDGVAVGLLMAEIRRERAGQDAAR